MMVTSEDRSHSRGEVAVNGVGKTQTGDLKQMRKAKKTCGSSCSFLLNILFLLKAVIEDTIAIVGET